MYTTKVLNKNVVKSYLTIGDPYRDPHVVEGKSSRQKGKQLMTVPPKNTCNGVGYFEKKTYSSDPLQDKTTYLSTQPMDKRKAGFGSKDASRRDEFMSHVRTEQYRETLDTEMKMLDKQKGNESPQQFELLDSINEAKHFPEGLQETKHLYDIGRSQNTEFNQKSHRDTFYTMRVGNSSFKRNNGPFMLTSESIGLGTDDVTGNRPTPKGASTKQFYDHSHLHV